MKKAALLLVIISTIILVGCKESYHCKRCPVTTDTIVNTEYKERIVEKIVEKLKDTIITVPVPDSKLIIEALVKCDSMNQAQLEEMTFKNEMQYVRLKIENGRLVQINSLTKDSLTFRIDYLERTIKEKTKIEKGLKEKIANTKVVPQELPWWKKMFMIIGILTVVIVIVLLVYNVLKRIKT
jgi:major membrane immunogen (membrane-anchored lipoprotein)